MYHNEAYVRKYGKSILSNPIGGKESMNLESCLLFGDREV